LNGDGFGDGIKGRKSVAEAALELNEAPFVPIIALRQNSIASKNETDYCSFRNFSQNYEE
jgi:hypothetical protein